MRTLAMTTTPPRSFPSEDSTSSLRLEAAMSLSNLKVLVTGASSGIGKATCQVLSKEGATVVGTGRNVEALQALKEEGSISDFVVGDISQPGECQKIVVEAAVNLLGGTLTTVVNAAGGLRGGAVGDGACNIENYEYNMTVNCRAPFEIMTAAIPFLKKCNDEKKEDKNRLFPAIVTVSSVNGKQSFAGCATYCMAKAAVDQMTRCASVDLAKYGIRVNNVNPGVIKTNLHRVSGLVQKWVSLGVTSTYNISPPFIDRWHE
jgi:NAD(P)-dependent dehydrogenase (short-subunit alcohol dehydrogenase family)